MTDDNSSEKTGSITDQAIAWLVRMQSDCVTDTDLDGLTQWLEQSERHRAAFEEIERLNSVISDHAPEIAVAERRTAADVVPLWSKRRPRRTGRLGAALAAACIFAAVGVGWFVDQGLQGVATVYQTAPGQVRSVELADDTRIQLDAATTLTARLGWRARRVELAQGEAAFDVAKDRARLFTILVGDQTVRVVGTSFNVRYYDRDLVVTVRRGVVELRQPNLGPQVLARLRPGDQWSHLDGSKNSSLTQVDAGTAFAWTQNRLVCDDQPLSEIAAYLDRRYATPIELVGEARNRRFTGVLELGPDEGVVADRLAAYLSLSVDHRADAIVLR